MTLGRALTRCDSSLSVACAIRDAAANELVVSPLVLSPPTLLPSTAGSNVTTGLVFDVAVYLMLKSFAFFHATRAFFFKCFRVAAASYSASIGFKTRKHTSY